MELKEALEGEIAFWQSLIDCQSRDTPTEVIERMMQARMLAEKKLSHLLCTPQRELPHIHND